MKRDLNPETTAATKATCYVFTYNNYSAEGEAALQIWMTEKTKYAIYGHEVGESGTPHLQGYLSLKRNTATRTLQKQLSALGIKLTLFYARGNPAQNRVYCTKQDENHFWEHGEIKSAGQGARNDLSALVDTIKTPGITLDEVAKAHPEEYIKYSGIARLHAVYEKDTIEEFRDVTVTALYGTGGTGKTSKAIDICRRLKINYYILSAPARGATLYYQRYSAEKALILDDFYGWITPHELFRVLDIYKLIIRVLYGDRYARWLYVFFTSNVHPTKFYKPEIFDKLDTEAWNRRFHNIYLMEYANPEKTAVKMPIAEKELRPLLKNIPVSLETNMSLTEDLPPSDYATDSGTEEEYSQPSPEPYREQD